MPALARLLLALLLLPVPTLAQSIAVGDIRVDYRLTGELTTPRPTLIVLAGSHADNLNRDFYPPASTLQAAGWLVLSLDLPAHGADARPGEPPTLAAWATRTLIGEDWIGWYTRRLSRVLDYGIAIGAIDPAQIALLGYSRGGFLALHAAARDARIGKVAAIQPVTDLRALSEFSGVPLPLTDPLAIRQLAPAAQVWLSIGWTDTRVSTELAIATTLSMRAGGLPWALQLHPERDGPHTFPPTIYAQAAAWLAGR